MDKIINNNMIMKDYNLYLWLCKEHNYNLGIKKICTKLLLHEELFQYHFYPQIKKKTVNASYAGAFDIFDEMVSYIKYTWKNGKEGLEQVSLKTRLAAICI
jgi:hypothetical protein